MIKWIFWDNDGVLVDTESLYFRACRATLARAGIRLDRASFIEISLKNGRSPLELAVEKGIDAGGVQQLREARNRLYSRLLVNGVRVMDGVERALRRLSGTVSMGVVTNCRRIHFEIMHAKSGLLPFFDFVLTAEDLSRMKPDPAAYEDALKRCDAPPWQCVVVEDSQRGMDAAIGAGIRCIVVPNDLTRDADFAGAFKTVDTIGEAAEVILSMAG